MTRQERIKELKKYRNRKQGVEYQVFEETIKDLETLEDLEPKFEGGNAEADE